MLTKTLILAVVLAVCGCGEVYDHRPDGGDAAPVADAAPPPEQAQPPDQPAGQPPLGYYQRQCQWDACGGPLPNSAPATDPAPEQGQ